MLIISTAAAVRMFWQDGVEWVCLAVSRTLIDEPEFDIAVYLDREADRALEAARA